MSLVLEMGVWAVILILEALVSYLFNRSTLLHDGKWAAATLYHCPMSGVMATFAVYAE